MATTEASIPSARAPFLLSDGRISPVWMRFLTQLWERSGGSSDLTGSITKGAEAVNFADNSVLFVNSSGNISEDNANLNYEESTETLTAKNVLSDKIESSGETKMGGDLNHDGTKVGFYGNAPVTQSAGYTASNVTPDRSFDADTVVISELADVVGTLVSDLQLMGVLG